MKHDQTWPVDHSNQQLVNNCAVKHQTNWDVDAAVGIDDVVVAAVVVAVVGGVSNGGLSSFLRNRIYFETIITPFSNRSSKHHSLPRI